LKFHDEVTNGQGSGGIDCKLPMASDGFVSIGSEYLNAGIRAVR
jgi:hypothetical protein